MCVCGGKHLNLCASILPRAMSPGGGGGSGVAVVVVVAAAAVVVVVVVVVMCECECECECLLEKGVLRSKMSYEGAWEMLVLGGVRMVVAEC